MLQLLLPGIIILGIQIVSTLIIHHRVSDLTYVATISEAGSGDAYPIYCVLGIIASVLFFFGMCQYV